MIQSSRVERRMVCSTHVCGDSFHPAIGIIMSLHLYLARGEAESEEEASRSPSPLTTNLRLRLLCAYENGSVVLWKYTRKDKVKSVEGQGWEMVWKVKLHAESGAQTCSLPCD